MCKIQFQNKVNILAFDTYTHNIVTVGLIIAL